MIARVRSENSEAFALERNFCSFVFTFLLLLTLRVLTVVEMLIPFVFFLRVLRRGTQGKTPAFTENKMSVYNF